MDRDKLVERAASEYARIKKVTQVTGRFDFDQLELIGINTQQLLRDLAYDALKDIVAKELKSNINDIAGLLAYSETLNEIKTTGNKKTSRAVKQSNSTKTSTQSAATTIR